MKLRVNSNHRFIETSESTPFFYLGDTAWELFHRLTREEVDYYLKTRSEQKFNVIQAVVLAEFDGLRTPNRYGDLPLNNLDPAQPNEAYFQHVDYVVQKCAEQGMWMGMLPTWGDKVNLGWAGAAGPEVFTPKNAFIYGKFLSERYRDYPVIWILGGDREMKKPEHILVYRAMAAGIKAGGSEGIIGFHPNGGHSSSEYVIGEDWLDFNAIQSGHCGYDLPNWDMLSLDRVKLPTKPTFDMEPAYEDHWVMTPTWTPSENKYTDFDVRKQAYRAVLCGTCGHTYGCQPIWQFYNPTVYNGVNYSGLLWNEAVNLPGANQMRYLRAFCEEYHFERWEPAQEIILSTDNAGSNYTAAARDTEIGTIIIYMPTSKPLIINAGKGTLIWFNPRNGETLTGGNIEGKTTLMTPTDTDWVLLIIK